MDTISGSLSIQQLFSNRVFHVPDYQRGYAWEAPQRTDFLEDLEILAPDKDHYTGTVVLHQTGGSRPLVDEEGRAYQPFDVVDGQQRLTTVVLLLDAIRRALSSLGGETITLADGIRKSYVATKDIAGQPLYRLVLNADCDHYFRATALSDVPGPEGPQISSEKRLAEARAEFERYLAQEREAQREEYRSWLTDLYLKASTRLKVTLYQVETTAEVGVIFEVMNNRGKLLSELEKVKNYLLYAGSTISLPHNLSQVVNDTWAEIFRQLMAAGLDQSVDEDQLLRAHWLTYFDPQPREYHGSQSIKAEFDIRKFRDNHRALLDGLVRYAEGLRQSCVAYCDARSPERSTSFASLGNQQGFQADIRFWSAKLTRTGFVAPFLPLLIATRLRFGSDGRKYLELVRLCELFAFRVNRLLSRRSDAGQARLFRAANELQSGGISFDEALDRVYVVLQELAPDNEVTNKFGQEYFNWYDWAGLRYFLYEYEEHIASQKGTAPKVSWDEVRRREKQDTIEHILPQSAFDHYWRDRFDSSARGRYVNDLGNLTLTKNNASYSNKPFPDKRGRTDQTTPCYANSPLFIERQLASLEDWTPEEIERRKGRLVRWALERWKSEARQVTGEPVADTIDGDEENSGWGEDVETEFAEP